MYVIMCYEGNYAQMTSAFLTVSNILDEEANNIYNNVI